MKKIFYFIIPFITFFCFKTSALAVTDIAIYNENNLSNIAMHCTDSSECHTTANYSSIRNFAVAYKNGIEKDKTYKLTTTFTVCGYNTTHLGTNEQSYYNNITFTPILWPLGYVGKNGYEIKPEDSSFTRTSFYYDSSPGTTFPFCNNYSYDVIFKATATVNDGIFINYIRNGSVYFNGLYVKNIVYTFVNYQSMNAGIIDSIDQNSKTIIKGQKETTDAVNKNTQAIKDLTSNINSDDSSGATNEASEFFSGFETDTFGLTSIITAPLNLIGSITSSTCSPLGLEVPFVNKTLNLPCLSSIYQQYFGSFLTIYQTITFGIVAYWVCVRIFNLVKDFKNPEHDEIEVLDL